MPRDVYHMVVVSGPLGLVQRFDCFIRGKAPNSPDPQEFCFERVIALPAEFSIDQYGEADQAMEVAAWGVKWGPYDAGWTHEKVPGPPDERITRIGGGALIEYRFMCANGVPWPIYHALGGLWPELTFTIAWEDWETHGMGEVQGDSELFLELDIENDQDEFRYLGECRASALALLEARSTQWGRTCQICEAEYSGTEEEAGQLGWGIGLVPGLRDSEGCEANVLCPACGPQAGVGFGTFNQL